MYISFKVKSIHYLPSYRKIKADLELIMIGPHENYYRDLKGYFKAKINEGVIIKSRRQGIAAVFFCRVWLHLRLIVFVNGKLKK